MKTCFKTIMLSSFAIILALGINSFALPAETTQMKVATIDVQKVVTNSSQVKSLKNEYDKNIKDLQIFIDNAKKAISNEKDVNKKAQLEDKYNKELIAKKSALEKEYLKKLGVIDKDISEVIKKEASKKNYDLVLSKGVVLFGGEDITAQISSLVK